MEMSLCLTVGLLLVACGFGLSRLRPPDWASEGQLATSGRVIARWASFQRLVRLLNNGLIAIIGLSIATAGVLPHGRMWFLLWCAILVALLVCILLAFLDALSSLAGYRQAIPEAVRRSFENNRQ